MARSIYLTITQSGTGKSLVALGLVNYFLRKTSRIGYFKPLADGDKDSGLHDGHIDLIREYFNLPLEAEQMFGLFKKEAEYLMTHNQYDRVLELIVEKYKDLEEHCDVIICEGTNFDEATSAYEFDLNKDLAKNLGSPICLVEKAKDHETEDIVRSIQMAYDSFTEYGCEVMGVVINQVIDKRFADLQSVIHKALPPKLKLVFLVPHEPLLSYPTVQDVVEHLGAEILYGKSALGKQIGAYSVAAMQLPQYLEWFKKDALVVTPGDRGDIIVGCLLANESINYPSIAGLLLTTGHKPNPTIKKLIDGLPNPVPILSVKDSTFKAVGKLNEIRATLKPDEHFKISKALQLFETSVDMQQLEKEFADVKSIGMTPKMFEYNLVKRAKSQRKHIVLPEGDDERILQAAVDIKQRNICDLTLLGKKEEIEERAKKIGISLEGINLITPCDSPLREKYAQLFFEARKHKGVTLETARDLICDLSYFGTMMIYAGDADGMVSGAAHTTQHTIRPALQVIKTRPDSSLVSSVFFMCLPDRVVVYGDCAVNPNPTAEELAEIAIQSANTAISFGIEPKVAMLSYSSGSSGKGEDVEKVRTATEIVKAKWKDLKIEGPIQYDAAVDLNVGQKKLPGSEVAGRANVLIFPDLNTGNNTYKAVQRETKALAIGPVLQGLNKPVNDLSRGCLVGDVINTIIITAIQAQQ